MCLQVSSTLHLIGKAIVHGEETHNTLKYANRAKNIRISAHKNQIDVSYHISQYPLIIANLKAEIENLKNGGSTQMDSAALEKLTQVVEKVKKLHDKSKDKELEQLAIRSKLEWNDWSIEQLSSLDCPESRLEPLHQVCATLRHNLDELQTALDRYQGLIHRLLEAASQSFSTQLMERLSGQHDFYKLECRVLILQAQSEMVQAQSCKLSTLICNLLKKRNDQERIDLISGHSTPAPLFYDSCTDESDAESICAQSIIDPEEDLVLPSLPVTPMHKAAKLSHVSTIKKAKAPERDPELTPVLQRKRATQENPTANQSSISTHKRPRRRESMLPVLTERRNMIGQSPLLTAKKSQRVVLDGVARAESVSSSLRRSTRRNTMLPMALPLKKGKSGARPGD